MEALKDEGERGARGAAGEDLARSRYTWPAVANALHDLYVKILDKHANSKSRVVYCE